MSDFFAAPVRNDEKEKLAFIEHMNFLKSMSNAEHVLYKKWVEVQNYAQQIDRAAMAKANIWVPTDMTNKELTLKELESIDPVIEFVPPTDKKKMLEWLVLRVFIHSMEFEQNPGRFLRFIITDRNSGKYLGVSSLGSDVIAIACRDSWIGWDKESKLGKGRLRHSAIATTIVSTQPFGYNFLGGKLVAAMMCTEPVKQAWQDLYGETLAGITTTSLYGKHSMYQRIPFWKELGETAGKVMIKPDDYYYEYWHHYVKEQYPERYESQTSGGAGAGPATGVKQKIMSMIMKDLGMVQSHYMHGFQRGVYYAPFYENTKEFLRGEIEEKDLIPLKKLENDVGAVMEWWLPKAKNRYENVYADRLNDEILFYNRGVGMEWEDFKNCYLNEVGR